MKISISESLYRQLVEEAVVGQPASKENLWFAINLKICGYLGADASPLPVMGTPPPEYIYVLHLQQVMHQKASFSFDPLKIASEIVNRVIQNTAS